MRARYKPFASQESYFWPWILNWAHTKKLSRRLTAFINKICAKIHPIQGFKSLEDLGNHSPFESWHSVQFCQTRFYLTSETGSQSCAIKKQQFYSSVTEQEKKVSPYSSSFHLFSLQICQVRYQTAAKNNNIVESWVVYIHYTVIRGIFFILIFATNWNRIRATSWISILKEAIFGASDCDQ